MEPSESSPSVAENSRRRDGIFVPKPSKSFVVTPAVERVTQRAMVYLNAGYPIHLTGVSGTGKTSLAFHVASRLERPAVLLHGDSEFSRSDLVGGEVGYRKSKVVDNFIRSVLKTSEQVHKVWEDKRLAQACREGYTLIYDEFNRSRPEANNVLLSILEERILNLPTRGGQSEGYVRVHPNFRAIFTSNTKEYAGTHGTQSALLDRMITIKLEYPDRDTEVQITCTRSGMPEPLATRIVDLVRRVRTRLDDYHGPSVRGSVVLARVFADRTDDVSPSSAFFRDICLDVLRPARATSSPDAEAQTREVIMDAIDEMYTQIP
ncbi:MAG: gas vesicle protein GvpN [Longimonas sp.]|uniref:gas vesicle protein GvpN n=1 Tax=Longimonas sp. TaxID=2039626 RepID=UPI0033607167